MLMEQFDNLIFDNGPHSFTRVVAALSPVRRWPRAATSAKRAGAIRALKFMKEQGVLLSLRGDKGPTGELAKAAYFELMNPKIVVGVAIPDADQK